MTVVRTRTFKSENSEAVLLPSAVAFGDDVELIIIRSGDVMTIYPATISVSEMIDQLRALKTPPGMEQRDDNDIPDRERL